MKTDWDYTFLADAYLKRPEYAWDPIRRVLTEAGLKPGSRVCDVGAGTGHLTLPLVREGFKVVAIEPNDAMRKNGQTHTAGYAGVLWREGLAERTGEPPSSFDLVIFGSSFNVTDRFEALKETARILKPGGVFACLWNHRDLTDPLQSAIENKIRSLVTGYRYGTRREDPTSVIEASGFFKDIRAEEGNIRHTQSIADCMEAWRSHATLQRQAGPRFEEVLVGIEEVLRSVHQDPIRIPYTTRVWAALLKG